MQVCVPDFQLRLMFIPPLVDQQTIHHTCAIIVFTRFLRSLDHLIRDNPAVWFGDQFFLEFAGYALFEKVTQAQSYLGNFLGIESGGEVFFAVIGED
jgi:hypothetical protein